MNLPGIIMITGTDTGVGKTITTAALAAALHEQGRLQALPVRSRRRRFRHSRNHPARRRRDSRNRGGSPGAIGARRGSRHR
jgi:Mrp family chromosome partitioning ATPase